MAEPKGWKKRVQGILDGHDPRIGRTVAFVLQALILFSLLSLALESIPDLADWASRTLDAIELATVAIFTIEYVLRVIAAQRPLRYVFSFLGLIDLLAVLPFYLSLGGEYRALRAVRLVRLFWLFKIVRYSSALDTLGAAFRLVRAELIAFVIVAVLLIYACGIGIYFFEHEAQPDKFRSVFDGMWWAVVTLTTVGYGDLVPITAGGRLFTGAILFIGVGIIAVPTGLVSSALTTLRTQRARDQSTKAAAPSEGPPG